LGRVRKGYEVGKRGMKGEKFGAVFGDFVIYQKINFKP
jgi:hypothetical protein